MAFLPLPCSSLSRGSHAREAHCPPVKNDKNSRSYRAYIPHMVYPPFPYQYTVHTAIAALTRKATGVHAYITYFTQGATTARERAHYSALVAFRRPDASVGLSCRSIGRSGRRSIIRSHLPVTIHVPRRSKSRGSVIGHFSHLYLKRRSSAGSHRSLLSNCLVASPTNRCFRSV